MFKKIIIWGHKYHSHTHSYIHGGYYRAFKYLGYDVLWLDNSDNIDDYNFDGNFIESQAFAYLAIRSYLKLPISFPSTTRSKTAISGGDILQNF